MGGEAPNDLIPSFRTWKVRFVTVSVITGRINDVCALLMVHGYHLEFENTALILVPVCEGCEILLLGGLFTAVSFGKMRTGRTKTIVFFMW